MPNVYFALLLLFTPVLCAQTAPPSSSSNGFPQENAAQAPRAGQSVPDPLDEIIALPNSPEKLRQLQQIARRYRMAFHPAAYRAVAAGLRLAESRSDEAAVAYFHELSIPLKNFARETEETGHHIDRALAHYEAVGNEDKAWQLKLRQVQHLVAKKEFPAVSERAYELMSSAEAARDTAAMAMLQSFLSLSYTSMEDVARGLESDSLAVRWARRGGDTLVLTKVLRNHVYTLLLSGRFDLVLDPTVEALGYAEQSGDSLMVHHVLQVLAFFYLTISDTDSAEQVYRRMQAIEGENASVATLSGLASLYQKLGDDERARPILLDLVKVGYKKKMGHFFIGQLYEQLMIHKFSTEQYDTLAKYGYLARFQDDSLAAEANANNLLELQTQYDTEKKEARIALQESQLAQQRTQLYAVLAGLLLALAAGAVFFVLARRLRRRNAENERLVGEKETLIGEIHHRVKNNLQVISSLLQLQRRDLGADDHQAQDALLDSQSRVQAMGLLHQRLYQGTEVTSVAMPAYLKDLGDTLLDAYRLDDRVELYYDVEDVTLDVDTAIPLGLIVNELITNSLKYAFPGGREGTVEVSLEKYGADLVLRVSDDGVGKNGEGVSAGGTGFGSDLVKLLSQKLKGRLETGGEGGYATMLTFPASALAAA